jgi:putative ABC transport system ATP-binding protein
MANKSKQTIIDLKDVKKSYWLGSKQFPILFGVSVQINQGEFVALMGPSGSGKSTLMNIIGCLDVPDGGSYMLNNQNVSKLNKDELAEVRNRYIGFVFQNFNLLARQSALKNVSLPSFYAATEDLSRAKELLERVGLGDRLENKPSEMSGGQRQRVAIARSLMNNPDLILADEPTGNLDSKSATEVMHILKKLNEEQGKTIVVVTHDDYTASFAKRTINLKDGLIQPEESIKKS